MKSYEEMTEAVLTRVGKERQVCQRRKRSVLTVITSVCCLSIILVGALWLGQPDRKMPERNVNREPRMSFVVKCSATEVQPAKLIKDLVVPCQSMVRVCDVTGLSEIEADEVWKAAKDFGKTVFANTDADDSSSHWKSDTAIISLICDGRIELLIDDIHEVEDMHATTTDMGAVSLGAADRSTGNDSVVVYWTLSQAAIKQIEDDPKIKLSDLSYSITVDLTFRDGTTEHALIDIIVEDDGYVYAAQRGITIA